MTAAVESDRARFLSRVRKTESCWFWTAGRDTHGYGKFRFRGRQLGAHRVAFEMFFGPVPTAEQAGYRVTLDHLCRNRACVNPAHLEPVSNRVNILRSPIGITARQARQTHCLRGHEFTPANIYRWRGSRICRECRRVRRVTGRAR